MVKAAASSLTLWFGRRWFTPFGRGGRLAYSAEAYRGRRTANVRPTMFEITPAQRHALLRVLRKALVHVRSFTGVSVARDHDGGVTPGMWKAANAALNAVHNMPDWREAQSSTKTFSSNRLRISITFLSWQDRRPTSCKRGRARLNASSPSLTRASAVPDGP